MNRATFDALYRQGSSSFNKEQIMDIIKNTKNDLSYSGKLFDNMKFILENDKSQSAVDAIVKAFDSFVDVKVVGQVVSDSCQILKFELSSNMSQEVKNAIVKRYSNLAQSLKNDKDNIRKAKEEEIICLLS
ncbi:MAG TPA: hypothetical protein DCZ34_01850 [Clostridiales bacterium]|nr:hypothetical protein [Clostridiales bacterium]